MKEHKKINKKQEFQKALNEVEDIKASEMRELMNLNFSIRAKYRNVKQRQMADLIKNNRITFVSGPPGTGKTLIALKTGLELIKDKKIPIENIVLTTPIVSVGPDIGHLPGSVEEKSGNYFSHFYSNLEKLVEKKVSKFLIESGLVKQKIINFMRGDTFGKYDEFGNPIGEFCILDEGQNMTAKEVKTFISRLGENSKIIILFDPNQIDIKLKNGEVCGAIDALNRLKTLEGVGFIEFEDDDIVRDPFLIEIMKRYRDS